MVIHCILVGEIHINVVFGLKIFGRRINIF